MRLDITRRPPRLLFTGVALATGEDLTIIACGTMVHPGLQAADMLRMEEVSVGVIDMHTIKPIDRVAILSAAGRSRVILTVKEHKRQRDIGRFEALYKKGGAHP